MKRDDITRLAKEAGLTQKPFCRWGGYLDDLVRFADLVAAAEREACAKVAETSYEKQVVWYPAGYSIDPNHLGEINKEAAARCAAAIRARGEVKP